MLKLHFREDFIPFHDVILVQICLSFQTVINYFRLYKQVILAVFRPSVKIHEKILHAFMTSMALCFFCIISLRLQFVCCNHAIFTSDFLGSFLIRLFFRVRAKCRKRRLKF